MNFDVTILGANSAKFAHGRHQTSQLLSHNEHLFLIDCGEGTQNQLMRYRLKTSRIHHIFISHLHGDHFLGLVGLILTMHLSGRTQELSIYGPPGLEEIITVQLRWSETMLNFALIVYPVAEGPSRLVYENEHLEVHSIPLLHRIVCNGYLFKEKSGKRRLIPASFETHGLLPQHVAQVRRGEDVRSEDGQVLIDHREVTLPPHPARSYAFCSDTRPMMENASLVREADLLYHEATFLDELHDRAAATYHSTARQAGLFAQEAGVRELLIGHYSSRYRDITPLLAEAQTVFSHTRLAEEGCTYEIPYPKAGVEAAPQPAPCADGEEA